MPRWKKILFGILCIGTCCCFGGGFCCLCGCGCCCNFCCNHCCGRHKPEEDPFSQFQVAKSNIQAKTKSKSKNFFYFIGRWRSSWYKYSKKYKWNITNCYYHKSTRNWSSIWFNHWKYSNSNASVIRVNITNKSIALFLQNISFRFTSIIIPRLFSASISNGIMIIFLVRFLSFVLFSTFHSIGLLALFYIYIFKKKHHGQKFCFFILCFYKRD